MELDKFLEGTATIELKGREQFLDSKEINLEYYMLEVDGYNFEEGRQKVYGIQVVKTEVDNNNRIHTETELVPDISPDKEAVREIIQKLIKNKVTPVSLQDVLEDTIGVC